MEEHNWTGVLLPIWLYKRIILCPSRTFMA